MKKLDKFILTSFIGPFFAILFIVIFAKVVGSMLPIAAEKIGVDPAVMANPLISTVTDTVSLLIYIYMAKLILHI